MSVDSAGRLVPRRVTGWHASPARRTPRGPADAPVARTRPSITLTGDHEVLTDSGYVAAEMLAAGHRVAAGVPGIAVRERRQDRQVESLAGGGGASVRALSSVHRELPNRLMPRLRSKTLRERHRRDEVFYCLDVEETHNFATSAGVVHNCRPPNNRNPEADEVASCLPFLEEQIRLISPARRRHARNVRGAGRSGHRRADRPPARPLADARAACASCRRFIPRSCCARPSARRTSGRT